MKSLRKQELKKYTVILTMLSMVQAAPMEHSDESIHQILYASSLHSSDRGPSIATGSSLNQHELVQTHAKAHRTEDLKSLIDFQELAHVPKVVPRKNVVQEDESLKVLPLTDVVPARKIAYKVSEPKAAPPKKSAKQESNPYRKPVGGFGVGWEYGGHGAGHGYYLQH